jgi:acyl-homoserine-lactone acylase
MPPDRLAATVRTDFVANSNDSYWLANLAQTWPAMSPMLGPIDNAQRPRTRAALELFAHRFVGDDGMPGTRMSSDALKVLWFDSRNYMAAQVLDDLLAACPVGTRTTLADGTDVPLDEACDVLRRWDRKDGIHSRGAHLFREFWKAASLLPNVYATPFDARDPVHTPRGLRTSDPAVRLALMQALGTAVRTFRTAGIALDAELGSVQYATIGSSTFPVAGGDEYEGVLNKQEVRAFDGKRYEPFFGTSYVQVVSLGGSGSTATGLLVYGQSVDPTSPYAPLQLKAYSEGRMFQLPTPK